jgi:acyl-CoA dehydrogenase
MGPLDLQPSARGTELWQAMRTFMDDCVLPAEALYQRQHAANDDPHRVPAIVEELKAEAKSRGLWNLFLPSHSGLGQLDYLPIAELSGWSPHLAPEAINGQAPDSGNMELLELFATPEQRERWLEPLLAGAIRSAFAMTEPDVASSDALNIATSIRPVDDGYVVSGRHDQHGHAEVTFEEVFVPRSHLLGEEGQGLAMAHARLGPGRLHHCARALGAAERAIALLVGRASSRTAFGSVLIDNVALRQRSRKYAWRSIRPDFSASRPPPRSTRTATRRPLPSSRWPRSRRHARPSALSMRQSRCTAAPESATTSRSPRCGAGIALCASSTAPMRSTSPRSPSR